MKRSLLLKNLRVVSPGLDLPGGAILLRDGKIEQVFAAGSPLPAADAEEDGAGLTAVPGFIDVHCHGRSGCDFSDGVQSGLETIAADKLKEGVTTLLPTGMTLGLDTLRAALETAAGYSGKGCKIPGVHLEGPFINPACLGAQNPEFVREPDARTVLELARVFPVRKVSFAPEMPGAARFVAELLAAGITPSAVHSKATYAEFAACHAAGLANLSHFCNQMSPLHHRDIGLVGAGLLHPDVYIEVICDKLHLAPEMIQLVFALKDTDHIQLITDAVRASGMPDGDYTLGGLPIRLAGGAARLVSSGALAGSALAMNTALKNVAELSGLPLSRLIGTTAWNQARALGLSGVGRIAPGYAADLTLLDGAFNVRRVRVDGVEKFRA